MFQGSPSKQPENISSKQASNFSTLYQPPCLVLQPENTSAPAHLLQNCSSKESKTLSDNAVLRRLQTDPNLFCLYPCPRLVLQPVMGCKATEPTFLKQQQICMKGTSKPTTPKECGKPQPTLKHQTACKCKQKSNGSEHPSKKQKMDTTDTESKVLCDIRALVNSSSDPKMTLQAVRSLIGTTFKNSESAEASISADRGFRCNMDTLQLKAVLSTNHYTKKTFSGVFPSDWLPKQRLHRRPAGLVVNTHPHNVPGEHWLAIYLEKDGRGEFFDSYGHPPNSPLFPKTIVRFLRKNASETVFQPRQLQASDSVVCGYHCIFFLQLRSKGLSFEQIQELYCDDLAQNDLMVEQFIKNKKGMSRLALNFFVQPQACVSCSEFHQHHNNIEFQ
ncbi:uncharacterized protein LOC143825879 [Paroedura picta]|uniref:uncharacterized protein LOC143825879 n=1 Tax=Paroedura picta TaxID=143630 RepID=UPI0040562F74